MFAAIAGRYDFLNHFLSGNIDRSWREECLRQVRKRLPQGHSLILDVGCGTADLSMAFSRIGRVVGCDFCHPMLRIGLRKIANAQKASAIDLVEGDALLLPFADSSFDVVASAFTLRNLADLATGVQEMHRVLRPGGALAILDFALPERGPVARLYRFYFTWILPRLGRWISGVDGPYSYLPNSVGTFPRAEELDQLLRESGFHEVSCHSLTAGVAVLLVANT